MNVSVRVVTYVRMMSMEYIEFIDRLRVLYSGEMVYRFNKNFSWETTKSFNSEIYNKRGYTTSTWEDIVSTAFNWNTTPEGWHFWKEVSVQTYLEVSDTHFTYVQPKCECGATIANAPVHSSWCPLSK